MSRINWTVLSNAKAEVIEALMERECIERRNAYMALKARKALKVPVYVHAIDQSVAPTVTMTQQKGDLS